MVISRAMPVLRHESPEQTRAFWVDFLGFEPAVDEPGFMMLVSPDVATTQLIVGDASVSADAADKLRDVDVSVDVGDVDAAYAEAQARGLDVVYPITTEPWGPRRFFVRLPGGTVVNVVGH
ncbi:MAG: VOC family protein [Janthinobacterium lividum]